MAKRASSARNLSPNEQNMKENQEKEILDILQNNQYASIDALAQALFVSPSTIRRKLNALQQKGLITRTHGGAQINDEKNFFPSFTFRVHQNSFEKKKMALAAMKLIENGNLIGYKYFDFQNVNKIGVEYRNGYKTPNSALTIKLSENGEKIAQISLNPNENWTKAETNVNIPNGTYPLFFIYEGDGAIELKEIYFIWKTQHYAT